MIIPALDIMNNKIVRLYQGNFKKNTIFSENILKKITQYVSEGAKFIHIVDLDSCKNPLRNRKNFINFFLKFKKFFFQIGGGIRTFCHASELLKLGIYRIVMGTSALKDPMILKKLFKKYGSDRIVLAIDVYVKQNNFTQVAINGWQEITNVTIENILNIYKHYSLKHVLCTDITKDGTLKGPNLQLYNWLVMRFPKIHFQASGGISNLQDIKNIKKTGVKHLIIGRSLLEKRFTFFEARKCWQNV
ncbi:1-(5-phosphoribosyl)-5-[(5-phosphoribosylamino)methylideneamino] imidazole-4-carboxamide isomerase [Buchnera aphidicola]|uniref:1-(5-phosphoribosyl)-5-[(5-phosphoribosylamino)methylideneamino] imidazole-4-carboxamide isomerase n=1 Tax=Buchnera aphidicola subsp. Tuberolachnus salignus TaxID=98804 RepID=A0A160SX54_BUCTT|nr:1-(5-phosphoribosyl)-5-[(5-phosphoribosylamino)methylideneamino] imidazole-4-carboxamide isomerase [Buchnera aphidicola]CUR53055.1 1-(5-phosphoribosyl)-5-[(5-phosphoribosylamino)methylideneamino] imidazole-4-carboxamide isomerase [Buchnera aphidicola (Tuberolachnus salignus)]